MIVFGAAVFVVVYASTGSQLRSQIDRDLDGDATQLSQSLRPYAGSSAGVVAAAATRYVLAQRYSATSTLLFVLIPGVPTVSNHPEVFGSSLGEPRESAPERAIEGRESGALLTPRLGYSMPQVPDVGHFRLLERPLDLGTVQVVVGAGEPLTIVERAQHGVARAFALAGAIALVLVLVASYLAGARVTAPLRRMAAVATRVDAGELGPRMELASGRADELRVLAEAFNHMLDRLAEAFASQRGFVADASHELRTPLTVIRGQLEVLATQDSPSQEEVRRVEQLVQAEITRISRLVDDLLVLVQAERTDFLRLESVELRSFVSELWDGMSLTAERRFELGPIPDGSLRADPDRVAQALRNLARNAIEHTAEGGGLVRLEVEPLPPDRVRFTVIDDGPGIPEADRERVFERFQRTDSSRSRAAGGAGLGLAIVRAIADAHGGYARVDGSRLVHGTSGTPGTRVELVLPGFRPA